jgi:8-oxo-dGTP pyrophosphatase MutT (NUDIX family)
MRAGAAGFEVFVQRRVPTMAFAAGMTVFPGGAREPADAHLAATAVREVLEETGVELALDRLVPWSRWVTPEGEPRRYDTYFFVAELLPGQEPVALGTEMDTVSWVTPAEALDAYERGELPMMPPTVVTLRELTAYDDIAAVLAGASSRTLDPVRPRFLDDEEGIRLELPGGEVFR